VKLPNWQRGRNTAQAEAWGRFNIRLAIFSIGTGDMVSSISAYSPGAYLRAARDVRAARLAHR
jgi:hypothetical protein